MNGANIIRVHDVKEMVRVARVADAIRRGKGCFRSFVRRFFKTESGFFQQPLKTHQFFSVSHPSIRSART